MSLGVPRNPFGRFVWAAAQLPRACWWLMREGELRKLLMLPALLTVIVGLSLLVGAAVLSGSLVSTWNATHDRTFIVSAAMTLEYLVTFAVLAALSVVLTWHAQGALAAPAFERMTLFVQRRVDGEAPKPEIGVREVMLRAVRALFPRVRSLIAWALSAAAAMVLVLIPVFGAPLAIAAQAIIAALFLSHSTITDNRTRLGLPRRLLLAEPALVLGLAAALVPLVLVPPVLFFFGGPVAISGALVALGSRRDSASEDLPERAASNQT